jgi:hypothetical protein
MFLLPYGSYSHYEGFIHLTKADYVRPLAPHRDRFAPQNRPLGVAICTQISGVFNHKVSGTSFSAFDMVSQILE